MIFRFDDCELDEARSELRRGGKPVALQPKPLALLALLLRERHRVVEKADILDELWPDTAVTESSLTRAVSLARRAIGDRGERARIRSHARRGYRFVGHVIEHEDDRAALDDASPSAAATVSVDPSDPFIGRSEPLAALQDAWHRTTAGFGSVVLVEGAAGIGKSRLVETFAGGLAADGQRVAFARSDEGTSAPAFWLWVQVLRDLASCTDLSAHAREVGGLAPELAERVPELHDAVRPAAAGVSTEQERFLVFDSVAQLLERCAAEQPIALVVEDLHLAGTESLALLEHLAERLRDAPMLVIAMVREESRERNAPLTRTLASLGRLETTRSLRLSGFGPAEIAHWVETRTGATPPREWVRALLERTEGNPLFLQEAVRILVESGALAPGHAPGRVDLRALPLRMMDVVESVLERLPAESLEVLEAASVLGRRFEVALLADVLAQPRATVLDALDGPVLAGVVNEDEDRPGLMFFANPLFQEVTRERLRPGRRARLHHAVAQVLERRHGETPTTGLSQLAEHHHRSLGVGDPVRAFEVARLAAAALERANAYEQAAHHHEQALAALDQQPAADAGLRMETLLDLGRAHRSSGDRERRRVVLSGAIELARQRDDPAGFAAAAIGFCDLGEWAAHDPEAQAHVDAALAEAAPERLSAAARSRLLSRKAYNLRDQRVEAEPPARAALELARASGDPHALAETLYTLHFVIAGPDDLVERVHLVREMEALVPSGGDADLTVIGLLDLATDQLIVGDAAGARKERARVDALVGPRPHRGVRWHTGVYDDGLALLEGRYADAQAGIPETHALGAWIGHPAATMCFAGQRLQVLRDCGASLSDVQAVASSDLGAARIGFFARALLAGLKGEADVAQGRATFEALVDRTLPEEPRSIDWLAAVAELARQALYYGDAERGAALREHLSPYRDLQAAVPVTVSYLGPVAYWTGRLAAQQGDLAGAGDDMEEAFARAESLGARPALARIEWAWAEILARRGNDKAAAEKAAEGDARAASLGMVPRLGP